MTLNCNEWALKLCENCSNTAFHSGIHLLNFMYKFTIILHIIQFRQGVLNKQYGSYTHTGHLDDVPY